MRISHVSYFKKIKVPRLLEIIIPLICINVISNNNRFILNYFAIQNSFNKRVTVHGRSSIKSFVQHRQRDWWQMANKLKRAKSQKQRDPREKNVQPIHTCECKNREHHYRRPLNNKRTVSFPPNERVMFSRTYAHNAKSDRSEKARRVDEPRVCARITFSKRQLSIDSPWKKKVMINAPRKSVCTREGSCSLKSAPIDRSR